MPRKLDVGSRKATTTTKKSTKRKYQHSGKQRDNSLLRRQRRQRARLRCITADCEDDGLDDDEGVVANAEAGMVGGTRVVGKETFLEISGVATEPGFGERGLLEELGPICGRPVTALVAAPEQVTNW